MRTFIAVEIPEEIREMIGTYIAAIRGMLRSVKWVAPHNLHLTVKFLGELEMTDMQNLKDCLLETASEFSPFTLELHGVGFFPSVNRPRVIWIGSDGGADYLLDVFQKLENSLEKSGFDRESRTFSPHLTIGRVKKDRKIMVPEGLPDFESVRFPVNSIALIKSTLTSRGPIYERVFESELANF